MLKDGKLYGRGSSDDGYGVYCVPGCVKMVQNLGKKHPRCILVLESGEESDILDLPYYMTKLKDRVGDLSLVICLDSGAGDYEHLWITNTLRGILGN